ncbi:MAG: hypothetical protein A2V75_01255 [Actinobacteria bacterium RBG_16_70_17]|nr:MAG: hypothetical protein A2V75_01255 [Actinobacteria bacterium RBG_16_70_17]
MVFEQVHFGVRNEPGQSPGGGVGAGEDILNAARELDRHLQATELSIAEDPWLLHEWAVMARDQTTELDDGLGHFDIAEDQSLDSV